MIELEICDHGLCFFLRDRLSIPLAAWDGQVPKLELPRVYALIELVQNGQATEADGAVILDPEDIYPSTKEPTDQEIIEFEDRLGLLGFPPIYGAEIFLSSEARIDESAFRIDVQFCRAVTDAGPKGLLKLTRRRNLLVGSQGEPIYTLSLYQYRLLKRIAEQNALPESKKDTRLNLTWFESIREAAAPVGARFSRTLQDQSVHRVSSFGVRFERDEDGALVIEPTAYGNGS